MNKLLFVLLGVGIFYITKFFSLNLDQDFRKFKAGDCVKATVPGVKVLENIEIYWKVIGFSEKTNSYLANGKGKENLFYFEENYNFDKEIMEGHNKVADTSICEAMPRYLAPY